MPTAVDASTGGGSVSKFGTPTKEAVEIAVSARGTLVEQVAPLSARIPFQFPSLCTCDDIPRPTCKSCFQKFGDVEQQLAPDIDTCVAWRTFNKCTKCRGMRPTGCEDQICYGLRRKGELKGKSQQEILESFRDGSYSREKFLRIRKAVALGNFDFINAKRRCVS